MLKKFFSALHNQGHVSWQLEQLRAAVARVELRQNAASSATALAQHEFRAFSQWGEDGIIQHLIRSTGVKEKTFVEFGVEDYQEANTRFLLMNNYWRGLVLDSSPDNVAKIRASELYWRYDLKAECAMITAENIDALLEMGGMRGNVGLLSIDIDGMDYWVWKAITVAKPAIVICEYNALFGVRHSVTIPYQASFSRGTAHFSHLYWGASIRALTELAREKGYCLVGSNQAGVNLFFVRRDHLGSLQELTVEEAYHRPSFRESRNEKGELTFAGYDEGRAMIGSLPVLDLSRQSIQPFSTFGE